MSENSAVLHTTWVPYLSFDSLSRCSLHERKKMASPSAGCKVCWLACQSLSEDRPDALIDVHPRPRPSTLDQLLDEVVTVPGGRYASISTQPVLFD